MGYFFFCDSFSPSSGFGPGLYGSSISDHGHKDVGSKSANKTTFISHFILINVSRIGGVIFLCTMIILKVGKPPL